MLPSNARVGCLDRRAASPAAVTIRRQKLASSMVENGQTPVCKENPDAAAADRRFTPLRGSALQFFGDARWLAYGETSR